MSRNLEIRIRLDAAEKRKLERDARKRKMTVAQHVRTLAGLEEAKRGRKPGSTGSGAGDLEPAGTTPGVRENPQVSPAPGVEASVRNAELDRGALHRTEPYPPAAVSERAADLERQGRSPAVALAEARAEYARERP